MKWIKNLFSKKKKYYPKQDNLINVIHPYRTPGGGWAFDDADVDLKGEMFVAGADDFLTMVTQNATKCTVTFSENMFPGFQYRLEWQKSREEINFGGQVVEFVSSDFGNYYYSDQLDVSVWFCPALFRYFKKAPKEIYAKIEYDDKAPKFVKPPMEARAVIYDDFIEEYYKDEYGVGGSLGGDYGK